MKIELQQCPNHHPRLPHRLRHKCLFIEPQLSRRRTQTASITRGWGHASNSRPRFLAVFLTNDPKRRTRQLANFTETFSREICPWSLKQSPETWTEANELIDEAWRENMWFNVQSAAALRNPSTICAFYAFLTLFQNFKRQRNMFYTKRFNNLKDLNASTFKTAWIYASNADVRFKHIEPSSAQWGKTKTGKQFYVFFCSKSKIKIRNIRILW